jgi:hypothetical protein
MERETGIEPATNSLEGCDSTTELLPPVAATRQLSMDASGNHTTRDNGKHQKMVERGGFEPPKDEVRQIYSLLPLAAQQSLRSASARSSQLEAAVSCLTGAGDGTRTRDLLITNQLLYQLSYASKLPVFKDTTASARHENCRQTGATRRGTKNCGL